MSKKALVLMYKDLQFCDTIKKAFEVKSVLLNDYIVRDSLLDLRLKQENEQINNLQLKLESVKKVDKWYYIGGGVLIGGVLRSLF